MKLISYSDFQKVIWDYHAANRRSFQWRETHDPYEIMVSEIMLQQTQTARVAEKYKIFLKVFPTAKALAGAPVSEVLTYWQGLGYNRRALNLQRAAKKVVEELKGVFPKSPSGLRELPGIGPYTAGAITAFAYNRPVPFIETNIRRVYLHFFFPDEEGITDKELLPIIEATVSNEDPREWYYALMDYGAQIPKVITNPNRRSKHYVVQSKFEGSNRQVRGGILASLVKDGPSTATLLSQRLGIEYDKIVANLVAMKDEGFLTKDRDIYSLSS